MRQLELFDGCRGQLTECHHALSVARSLLDGAAKLLQNPHAEGEVEYWLDETRLWMETGL